MNTAIERQIFFKGAMVRAILSGQKTVTRRTLKMPHGFWETSPTGELVPIPANCPYGKPGERLWVRESWATDAQLNAIAPRDLSQGEPIEYLADGAVRQTGCSMITQGKARPSIHMPRWVSRILLEITHVRVERLQDISNEQAIAEGVKSAEQDIDPDGNDYPPYELFGGLWTMINGMDSWNANPWVWVVEFKRVTQGMTAEGGGDDA